ncbi:hypothetical protein DH2020_000780 [Rehmannia glutinosa]|uniref:Helicase Helix-turn-helix domain-containing protein n=1 Tax=Rehmannia glutinosa TaxID=99300 RepID=A0ABR0XXS6_REHGL
MTTYGDRLLQIIQRLSQELGISLDKEPTAESPMPSKLAAIHNNKRLTPAKFEAWKMWQEDGLTIQQIANYPGRAAPIKEQTVHEYILEAGREGCSIDWARLCLEIGLTQEITKNIQNAVAKVGKEKLKPIKNELSEEYQTGEALSNLGSPVENVDYQMKVDSMHDDCSWRKSEDAIETVDTKQPVADDLTCSNKRQKLDVPRVQQSVAVELTENSVIDWLKNFKTG